MKKLLTIAALAGIASVSYGQGYVGFASTTGAIATSNSVAGPTGGSGPAGAVKTAGSYYFALFQAPVGTDPAGTAVTGDPTAQGWTFTGAYATNSSKGNFLGYGPLDTSSVAVSGSSGASADFLIVGWSANIGGTWAAAEAVMTNGSSATGLPVGTDYNIGTSLTGVQVEAAAGGPYNDVLGTATGLIPGLTLGTYIATSVPEPCTFALCGLGAAALVIFRRRS